MNITLGDEGMHIEALQNWVNMSGVATLEPDGKYGPKTAAACRIAFAGMGVRYESDEIPEALWKGALLRTGLAMLASIFAPTVGAPEL